MTNGEKLKEVFPTCETRQPREDIIEITLDGIIKIPVMLDWWNAPYKAESETEQGLNYADQDTLMSTT